MRTWRLRDLSQPRSHSEQKQDWPKFLQRLVGDQWQHGPSCVASYHPGAGKGPPLASLWHHHLRFQLGECSSFMNHTWVPLAVQWSRENMDFGEEGDGSGFRRKGTECTQELKVY